MTMNKRDWYIHCVAVALFVWAQSSAQAAQPVRSPNTIQELFVYLRQCVRLPPGTEGSELTLRFGLTHYGALKGKPMITHASLVGDAALQRAFVAAVLTALENCTPVPVTERFGRVIAEKVLTWRIRSGRDQAA